MTAKSSRRVVIINNIKSDKIEQAIFILRGNNNQKPDRNILKEAQGIIDDYISRVGGKETAKGSLPPEFIPPPSGKKRVSAGLMTIAVSAFLLGLIFVVRYYAG